MGPAGNFGFFWFVLSALGPSPTAAEALGCPHPLNLTHCRCPPGYEGPPWKMENDWEWPCEDINECVGEGPPPCPPSQSCHNTEGGFRCDCNSGYRRGTPKNGTGTPKNGTGTPGNGTEPPIYCEDVDECAEGGEGRCRGGLVCLNTPGAFECHCPPPGRGPPDPDTQECPAFPVPPEICAGEKGCDLGVTLTRISEELRGGRDPLSVLKELLAALEGSLGGSWAGLAPPERHPRLSALLAAAEGLLRGAGALLPAGTAPRVTGVTSPRSALSLAVSRGPLPAPVTLGVPEVTLEVPPEVALDKDSDLSLVALLTLGGLPEALQGGPRVQWEGWGSLPRPPRRGRPFPSYRVLSPVATAFVTREGPRASPEVTLSFRHPAPDPKLGGRVLCAFWDPREGRWDTGGCREVPPKNGTPPPGSPPGTVCACDHLTSFAVLLAFNEIQVAQNQPKNTPETSSERL